MTNNPGRTIDVKGPVPVTKESVKQNVPIRVISAQTDAIEKIAERMAKKKSNKQTKGDKDKKKTTKKKAKKKSAPKENGIKKKNISKTRQTKPRKKGGKKAVRNPLEFADVLAGE
jgi:hypothetical protein